MFLDENGREIGTNIKERNLAELRTYFSTISGSVFGDDLGTLNVYFSGISESKLEQNLNEDLPNTGVKVSITETTINGNKVIVKLSDQSNIEVNLT